MAQKKYTGKRLIIDARFQSDGRWYTLNEVRESESEGKPQRVGVIHSDLCGSTGDVDNRGRR